MKSQGYVIALTLVCILLGALCMVQLKTQQNLRVSLPTHSASDLAHMLREQENTRVALEQEIQRVKKDRGEQNLQQQLRRLKTLLGLVPVTGPGIRMNLTVLGDKGKAGASKDAYIDPIYLDTVVNELWAAGAEAISVNGERVISNTGFGAAPTGFGLIMNGRVVNPPFEILATGDPVTLDSAMRMRNSAVDLMKYYGLSVSMTQEQNLLIPAYRDQIHYAYVSSPEPQERR